MKHQSRQEWLEQECEFTISPECDECPYVFYDENCRSKCERKKYDFCRNGKQLEEKGVL